MTASDGVPRRAGLVGASRLGDMVHLLDLWTGAVFRRVRLNAERAVVPAWRRYAKNGMVVLAAIVVSMLAVDPAAIQFAGALPASVNSAFNWYTDFGQSQWLLVPSGVLYLVTVVLAATAPMGRFGYGVLAALAARFGFLFVAIGMPSLLVTIIKRVIGRVRPSEFGPFAYHPFSWRAAYASLPSGHTTTAFAALVAISLVAPRLRPLMWVYALLVALSRVVVSAHFPSDVIAGAAFGALGAIMVRDWFAARRVAFYVASDGSVVSLPGPSWGRIKRVAATLLGQ